MALVLVRQREDLPYLLNERRLLGCAAEIGVNRGKFSARLLARWRGAHLLSVDPWASAPPGEYVDLANGRPSRAGRPGTRPCART